jgi:hypothetical protein
MAHLHWETVMKLFTTPLSASTRVLALLILGLALLAGGYRWGSTAADNQHAATQLKKERAAATQFQQEVQRGQTASLVHQAEARELNASYSQLQEVFNDYKKRYPLLVRRAATPGTAVAPATTATPGATGCINLVAVPDTAADADTQLSAGAVWMWNSALTGANAPLGACSLADQSEPACAVEAGVTLADAWANHAENARLCAQDRLAHQHLIDYIIKGTPHAD